MVGNQDIENGLQSGNVDNIAGSWITSDVFELEEN